MIIGVLMIVGLFAGLFVYSVCRIGVKATSIIFLGIIGLGLFIAIADSLILWNDPLYLIRALLGM